MSVSDLMVRIVMMQEGIKSPSNCKKWLERIHNDSVAQQAKEDEIKIKLDELYAKLPNVPDGGFSSDEEYELWLASATKINALLRRYSTVRAQRKHWFLAKFWHTMKSM
ncbi:MAG: hypothetical protein H7145_13365 [Akkermansiaceae bacterium]|nr:hypothetical protein [Armatimonadota bacterium]